MNRNSLITIAVSFAVVCPAVPYLGNPANLSALGFFVLLLLARKRSILSYLVYSALLLLILAVISTIAGMSFAKGSYSLNPNVMGVYFRVALCFLVVASSTNHSALHQNLLLLGALSSAFGILQALVPAIADFSSIYYLSAERAAVLERNDYSTIIVRSISFFESPSSVGLMSIILLLLSLRSFLLGSIGAPTFFFFVGLHLLAGVLSLSKVFFVGLVIVALYSAFLPKYRLVTPLTLVATVIAIVQLLPDASLYRDLIEFTADSAFDPSAAFDGRYLPEQLAAIQNSLLLGYGIVQFEGLIINDSAYLSMIYTFGLFGFFLIAIHLFALLLLHRSSVQPLLLLVIILILAAGVGANSLLGFRLDIYLTALMATLFTKEKLSNSFKQNGPKGAGGVVTRLHE